MKIDVKYNESLNLLHSSIRYQFVHQFVLLLSYVINDDTNIGHLRRPGIVNHRFLSIDDKSGENFPSQEIKYDWELEEWQKTIKF